MLNWLPGMKIQSDDSKVEKKGIVSACAPILPSSLKLIDDTPTLADLSASSSERKEEKKEGITPFAGVTSLALKAVEPGGNPVDEVKHQYGLRHTDFEDHSPVLDPLPLFRRATSVGDSTGQNLLLTKHLLRESPSSLRGMKIKTSIGTITTLTVNGAGLVNTVFSNSGLAATTEFPLFAGLFDEFFVHTMHLEFVPLNQFQTQPSMSFTLPASGILMCTPLHHGASTYSTTAAMANNRLLRIESSAKPWRMRWENVESSTSTVLPNPSTSAPTATQSWCLTASTNANLYTGLIQVRNNFAFSGATSSTIADVVVRWDVSFRVRV